MKSLLEVAAELPSVDMKELCNAFDKENKEQAQKDVKEALRYRSSPEELEKLKVEHLQRVKQFNTRNAKAKKTTEEDFENVTFSLEDEPEIKKDFLGTSLGECNRDFEKLTYVQVEALGRIARTDELLGEMLAALEQAGANQRWLDKAKASFDCGIMEVSRAVLKPKGI